MSARLTVCEFAIVFPPHRMIQRSPSIHTVIEPLGPVSPRGIFWPNSNRAIDPIEIPTSQHSLCPNDCIRLITSAVEIRVSNAISPLRNPPHHLRHQLVAPPPARARRASPACRRRAPRTARCSDDRAVVVLVVDEVHGRAGHLHAAREHGLVHVVAVHALAAERGNQGGMHVDRAAVGSARAARRGRGSRGTRRARRRALRARRGARR